MDGLPLFMTPCRWIKWDLQPNSRINAEPPRRGILYLTTTSLEFSGKTKPLGGNLRATLITRLAAQMAGDFTFSLPLVLITAISARKSSFKILGKEYTGVYLDIHYKRSESSHALRKLMAYPHFGPLLEDAHKLDSSFYISDELKSQYVPEEEAKNWVRFIAYQQKRNQEETHAA